MIHRMTLNKNTALIIPKAAPAILFTKPNNIISTNFSSIFPIINTTKTITINVKTKAKIAKYLSPISKFRVRKFEAK